MEDFKISDSRAAELIKDYATRLKNATDEVSKSVYLNTILRLCDGIMGTS
ncbi:hypothetical protein [Sphingobacterium griseoflavum]|nr:hypothetical protein [Sphingobacterium griseoflavum]